MTLTTYITDEQDIYEVRVAMKAIVRKAIFNTLVYFLKHFITLV